jgi:hypothetical protein
MEPDDGRFQSEIDNSIALKNDELTASPKQKKVSALNAGAL